MSTRATYSFEDINYGDVYTAYIHHDGYPAGAAGYLRNKPTRIEELIRDNARAEVTRSHYFHSDTEYRYSIKGENITCESGYGPLAKGWDVFFEGTIEEFIKKYWNEISDSVKETEDARKKE